MTHESNALAITGCRLQRVHCNRLVDPRHCSHEPTILQERHSFETFGATAYSPCGVPCRGRRCIRSSGCPSRLHRPSHDALYGATPDVVNRTDSILRVTKRTFDTCTHPSVALPDEHRPECCGHVPGFAGLPATRRPRCPNPGARLSSSLLANHAPSVAPARTVPTPSYPRQRNAIPRSSRHARHSPKETSESCRAPIRVPCE